MSCRRAASQDQPAGWVWGGLVGGPARSSGAHPHVKGDGRDTTSSVWGVRGTGALLVLLGLAFSQVRRQLMGHAGRADLCSQGRCVRWRPGPTVQLAGGTLGPPRTEAVTSAWLLALGFAPIGEWSSLCSRTEALSSLPVCLPAPSLSPDLPPGEGRLPGARGVAGAFALH